MPKRISHLLAALIALLSFAHGAATQTQSLECPTISVIGPAGILADDQLMPFTATVNQKGSTYQPVFEWSLNAGEIVSGQGTEKVSVRRSNSSNSSLTVTVALLGLPKGCTATASETVSGPHPPPDAVKIGEMLNAEPADLELIRRFRDELNKNTNNQGYIYIAYPAILPKEQVSARERAVLDAMASERFGHHSRITLVQVTSSRDVTEFWRVPPGASNPACEACAPVRSGCPSIGIERGAGIVKAGDHIEFMANDRNNFGGLAFHWTVKNGKIQGGQGTPKIRVLPVTYITRPIEAVLKVRGLPEGCADTFEESYAMPCHPYLATSVDVSFWSEYKTLLWTGERKQLEGIFARGLRWQPEKIVYIERGFPLNSTVRTRNAAISRIRNYILSTLKIPRNKLYIRSRIGRTATRLYLVPNDSPVLDPNWKESCVQE